MTPRQLDMFNANVELAERVADRVWQRTPHLNGLDREDYRQYAMVGLIDAVKRYRPRRGEFRRYAWQRIHGAVREGIREADEVKRMHRKAGMRAAKQILDSRIDSDADRAVMLRDMIASSDSHRSRLDAFDEIQSILGALPRESRAVVYLHLADGLEPWQVGCVLGMTSERVNLTLDAALQTLSRSRIRPTRSDRRLTEQPSLFS